MSLDFYLSEIDNYEEVCWREEDGQRLMNPVTEALIFATMAIGVNYITAKNVTKVYGRLLAWERVGNSTFLRHPTGGPRPIEYGDVKRHIGLRTNASPITEAAFAKYVMQQAYEVAGREERKDS